MTPEELSEIEHARPNDAAVRELAAALRKAWGTSQKLIAQMHPRLGPDTVKGAGVVINELGCERDALRTERDELLAWARTAYQWLSVDGRTSVTCHAPAIVIQFEGEAASANSLAPISNPDGRMAAAASSLEHVWVNDECRACGASAFNTGRFCCAGTSKVDDESEGG